MSATRTRTALSLLAASGLVLTLTGCFGSAPVEETVDEQPEVDVVESTAPAAEAGDQSAALETYVASAQAAIPGLEEQFADSFSDIQILAVPPNTVEYAYYYLNPMDAAVTAANLDASIDQFQSAVESAVIPEMEANGITDSPTVRYTYYNSDGSLIWSNDFTAS